MRRLDSTLLVTTLSLCLAACTNVLAPPSSSGTGPHPQAIVVQIDPQSEFSSVSVGGSGLKVQATVANDSANAGVTWSLGGNPSCGNTAACGTLTPSLTSNLSVTYLPPTIFPAAPLSVTLTATSVIDKSKSNSFSFSISATAASGPFSGSYAFLARGFSPNGSPMAIVGSLHVDGMGHITDGELDLNVGGTITNVPGPLTGTYTLDSSFNGIAAGTLTFQAPGAANSATLQYVLSADGTRGKVIEYDNFAFLNAGEILLQDPVSLATTTSAGTYAFGVNSDAPAGQRVVEAGQFVLGASGITGGAADIGQAGAASPVFSPILAAAGTATTDAHGRGVLTLTTNETATQYAYYLVNAAQLELLEIDNGGALGTVAAGTAHKQLPLSSSSVHATSVLQMTGVDAPSGSQNFAPSVIIGVMSISTASAFHLTFDSNDMGTVLTTHPESGTLVSFDPATGRGVLAISQGFASGFMNSAVLYLYDVGKGFVIDADAAASTGGPLNGPIVNRAYAGTFTTQSGAPFTAQSLSGNLLAVSGASATDSIPNIAAAANFDAAVGIFSAVVVVTSLPSQAGQEANKMFTGSASLTDLTLGHGNATFPSGFFGDFALNQNAPATFYLIAPNQLVVIGTLSGTPSGVSFFDPQ